MMYKAYRFDSIYEIRDFLNGEGVKPTDIVGIYRDEKNQDRAYYDLLYVKRTESEE